MPFLEVITRHLYSRPTLLARNRASLEEQTDPDYEQTILTDSQGHGLESANHRIALHMRRVRGEYIWILDDDDICIAPTLIADLKRIVAEEDPHVIMLRMDHGPRGVLPPTYLWGQTPEKGKIGSSAFVVRANVFRAFCDYWRAPSAADYAFIHAVFTQTADLRVAWHFLTASRVQVLGYGKGEAALGIEAEVAPA